MKQRFISPEREHILTFLDKVMLQFLGWTARWGASLGQVGARDRTGPVPPTATRPTG
jgi:hypothetical protein